MKVKIAITLLCLALLGSGCGGEEADRQAVEGGVPLARVGKALLTSETLENLLPESDGMPITTEEKRRYVERWIDTEILYQEALERGLGEDPRVRARLRSLEQEFLADHLTFIELRERTAVTEEEIQKYFSAHEDEYLNEYHVRHILVSSREEAEEVKELLSTKSFAWVANRYSIDPVARRGGDLGYLTKGNMIPEFEEVIFDMEPGEVSEIVKSDFGYHVIMLVGMRESLVTVDYADVRESIMNKLLIDKRKRVFEELVTSLRSAADIEYYDTSYLPDSVPDLIEEPPDTDQVPIEEGWEQ